MRKNIIFILLAALFVFSSVQTTFAVNKVVTASEHIISMAGVKARLVEQYQQGTTVYPGSTVDKTVNVKNTGNSDVIVRVKVEKAWGETRGADGKVVADPQYATDNILIDYNTEYWRYDPTDGYFYYKGVLKPGETTLEPLLKQFTIDKTTGNEYAGLQADIVVKMECVQAVANGASVWNKTFTDLGINNYTPPAVSTTPTTVTFVNEDDDFVFDPVSSDLFANFKNLLPGETRSQVIEVKNTYQNDNGVEIFLHAEDINQNISDPATLALVNKLLREYATIVVTDETGKVIYDGPVWGKPDSNAANPDSMHNDISLGIFAPGASKKLNVQLRLDPAMDNQYQELLGLIKWVWSAEPVPNNPEKFNIAGKKIWDHRNNPESNRPTSITLIVKADGEVILQKQITAADHWQWNIEVDKYAADGHEISYTVDEAHIKDYYKYVDGFDITNVYWPESLDNPPPPHAGGNPPPDGPKTGDDSNLTLWASLMGVSLAGLIFMTIYTIGQKRKKRKHA